MIRPCASLLITAVLGIALSLPAAAQTDYSRRDAIRQAVISAVDSNVSTAIESSVQWATNFAVNTALRNAMDAMLNSSMAWSDWRDNATCPDGSETNFGDDYRTYTAVEEHTLQAGISSVYVHGVPNGGVSVRGWDRNEVQVTACKYVGAENDAAGQQQLSAIQVQINGGDVTAMGPDRSEDQHWTVHFLVRAPRNVSFRLETRNGPLSIRDTGSDVEASTINGPLSVKLASGNVHATTQNGPLSIADCSGNITASAQNGPLTVSLNDKEWRGQGLDASTQNGPLTVRVPEGYQSGIDIDASGHSPWSCSLRDCDAVQSSKPWNRQTHVHLGNGGTVVRVSTVNGPVHIGSSME